MGSRVGSVSDDAPQHVFVSYVREDGDAVDGLCEVLNASQIPYWRDRSSLAPGDAWKATIRDAIRGGSLVFLACFSENSRGRSKSHMNEELTLAVEEFRKMPPGRTWLIPVRFDDGAVPEWDLGAGRTLADLNYVDLFGPRYAPQAVSLISTIERVMGSNRSSPEHILAAVDAAHDAERGPLLRRLTKEMLPDPSRRIELDDLVSGEVRRVVEAMADPERFPSENLVGSDAERLATLAETASRYWALVQPFCFSLQVAARWASPDQLAPWVGGIRSFARAARRLRSGVVALLEVGQIVPLSAVMTAAVSSVASARWDNLQTLVAAPTIEDRGRTNEPLPLLEAVNPWEPFRDTELAASVLARYAATDESFAASARYFTDQRGGKLFTPVAEWLHTVLRPVFEEQLPEPDEYASEFDRTEVILGILGQDSATQQYGDHPNSDWLAKSRWFGRSTWRSRRGYDSPLAALQKDLGVHGLNWPPLRGGLFGSDANRAAAAIDAYEIDFAEVARRRY